MPATVPAEFARKWRGGTAKCCETSQFARNALGRADGAEAVTLFGRLRPDIVLMDLQMPVIVGLEASLKIRKDLALSVPIVALTASALNEESHRCLDAGMNDFVRKPYRFDEIYECLARQLGLQYIYADKQATHVAEVVPLTAEMITILPQELRKKLIKALESLNQEQISTVIEQVLPYDLVLYKTLSQLVEYFDYPTILNALRTNVSANET